ncbi:MAG: aromatic amino acid hydroxylase [Arenicella sp.]|jgi:phenylalanine-4-hydroxylase|nr:aromatic amino acid hydroxylase [Arenicella sp.]
MQTQQEIAAQLPAHLRAFIAQQDYSIYTDRDQAVWRFLLQGLGNNLGVSAHPVYAKGLKKAGISVEHIPRIEEINDALTAMDWSAVTVDGFLPPAVFMEFQALKVLPIAVDMRSFAQILYTPAPDIVHESAGHAPFIADVDYAEFLQRFGELGMRAVATRQDMDAYLAVRRLSVIKQRTDTTPEEIAKAEQAVEDASAAVTELSEAALLARLHWWTVEYGLVGTVDEYHIFGAGLLSSLGESTNCLDDKTVIKKPLTVDAINQGYDITKEQPLLYVTQNCRHLTQVLEEFGRQMCVSQGGSRSLRTVIKAATVNTAQLNSGLEVSGVFTEMLTDAVDNPIFIKTTGPTQLAFQGAELQSQGVAHHPHGFSTPVGRLIDMERCLSEYTVDELHKHGITIGERVVLRFLSGIVVDGKLTAVTRRKQRNLIFTFTDCSMHDQEGTVLYDPEWGTFDMAVGDSVVSVFGGAADLTAYGAETLFGEIISVDSQPNPVDPKVNAIYAHIRKLRESVDKQNGATNILSQELAKEAYELTQKALQIAADEWLLYYELYELDPTNTVAEQQLKACLEKAQKHGDQSTLSLLKQAELNLEAAHET